MHSTFIILSLLFFSCASKTQEKDKSQCVKNYMSLIEKSENKINDLIKQNNEIDKYFINLLASSPPNKILKTTNIFFEKHTAIVDSMYFLIEDLNEVYSKSKSFLSSTNETAIFKLQFKISMYKKTCNEIIVHMSQMDSVYNLSITHAHLKDNSVSFFRASEPIIKNIKFQEKNKKNQYTEIINEINKCMLVYKNYNPNLSINCNF